MKKKGIIAALLFLSVGFAAVSTNLFINGSTSIKSNEDDFMVYYSNAKVNGTQDLSVVESETKLSFKTTLDEIGETYVLDYDVTNGSKIYDAQLTMSCTAGNNYLTVTNEFDTSTNLGATKTRSGKLTLELTKSYTGSDLDVAITCTLNANAVERNSLGSDTPAESIGDNYGIGRLIVIGEERFNVISETDDTVTMFASYVLGRDYRQTKSSKLGDYAVTFSNTTGWEYAPGPKEIDIFTWSPDFATYINEYVSFLKTETGDNTITGNLITVTELITLGYDGPHDYSPRQDVSYEFTNLNYNNWLFNGQGWLTRSATSARGDYIYYYSGNGTGSLVNPSYPAGVRPVITISKSALQNYLNS